MSESKIFNMTDQLLELYNESKLYFKPLLSKEIEIRKIKTEETDKKKLRQICEEELGFN